MCFEATSLCQDVTGFTYSNIRHQVRLSARVMGVIKSEFHAEGSVGNV